MQFTSVRAINKAIQDSCWGKNAGKNVYVKVYDSEPQTLLERHLNPDKKDYTLVRVGRARSDKSGQLYVMLQGFLDADNPEWMPCAWSDLVVQ